MHIEKEAVESITNLSKDGIKMRRKCNHSAQVFKNANN